MRNTFNSCRRMSSVPMYTTQSNPISAHTVAVATPCCPAPVSAITRCLPIRSTSSALPQTVIDLVRPSVQQIFALQIDPCASEFLREPPRKKQRRRTPRIRPQQSVQPRRNFGSLLRLLVLALQLIERSHQGLRHIPPAINTKPSRLVCMSRNSRSKGNPRVPHPSRVLCG